MKNLLRFLLFAALSFAGRGQNITLQIDPATKQLTAPSRVIVVPSGSSIMASGTGQIQATNLTGISIAPAAPLTGGGPLSGTVAIGITKADATHNGYLSSTDWNLFNGAVGANGITSLTGDGTATGPGAAAFTLATVNGSPGTFGNATSSLTATVDAKGRITALSSQPFSVSVSGISGLGTGVAAFLGTPSSANLLTAMTTKTGTGLLVFGTSPTLVTPNIASIVNTGTLTLPTATDTIVGRATSDTLTNKTIDGGSNTLTNIPNSSLGNSTVTIGTTSIALGATVAKITGLGTPTAGTDAATKDYVDATSGSAIVAGTGLQKSGLTLSTSNIPNASLANSTITVAGKTISLGGSATLAASDLTNGTTGTGSVALSASPTLSGTPLAPTAAVDTSTTQLATTAFVIGQASGVSDGNPIMDGSATRGASTHYARADHVHPTDTSLVPKTTTVNSKALSSNISLNASDIGLGSVTNDVQTKAAIVPNTAPTGGQVLVGNSGGTAYAPVSVSGDLSLSSAGVSTLTTVNSSPGVFGGGNLTLSATVNAKGLVTALSSQAISIAPTQINSTTGTGAAVLSASPAIMGTPTAPTAAVDTTTTQLATTAFVIGQASAVGDGTPGMDGTAARGTSTHFARADHIHPTDTSLVPKTTTVNGYALSANVTLVKADVGLGNVTNDAQTKAAVMPNTAPSSGQFPIGNAGGTAYAPASLSGDATLASTGALALATVNSNVGTFGNASTTTTATVNAKGLVTAISQQSISIAPTQINSTTGTGAAVLAASPTLTGTPAAPTAAVDTSTTQIATTGFVIAQAAAVADGTPNMDGTASRGTLTKYARADHTHPTDTSLVPKTTTVNGHALSANVTVTASDVGLGSVTNDAQTKAAIVPNSLPSAAQILVGNSGGTAYAPVSVSGDASLSSAGVVTLPTVNSNVGSFGDATHSVTATVDAKGRITAMSQTLIPGASAANPSASVGLSAVNGSASTFMRSDGAPALSTTISPTMTGAWTFSGNVTIWQGNRDNDNSGSDYGQIIRLLPLTITHQGTISNSTIRGISLAGPTIAAVSTSDLLHAPTLYVSAPTAGTNMTLTHSWAIQSDGGSIFFSGGGGDPAGGYYTSNDLVSVLGVHVSSLGGSLHAAMQGLTDYQGSSSGTARYIGGHFYSYSGHSSTGDLTVTSLAGLTGVRAAVAHNGQGTASLIAALSAEVAGNTDPGHYDGHTRPVTTGVGVWIVPLALPDPSALWGTYRGIWINNPGSAVAGTVANWDGLVIDTINGGLGGSVTAAMRIGNNPSFFAGQTIMTWATSAPGSGGLPALSSYNGKLIVQGGTTTGAGGAGLITLTNTSSSLTTGDFVGGIEFFNNDATGGTNGVEAKIVSVITTSNGRGTGLAFYTGIGGMTEKFRVDENGYVMIAATSNHSGEKLQVTGNAYASGTFVAGSTISTSATIVTSAGVGWDLGAYNTGGSGLIVQTTKWIDATIGGTPVKIAVVE